MFLVGDPMQSIYGFREAEVHVSSGCREKGIGNVRADAVDVEGQFPFQFGDCELGQ